jgi:hypothetical protein
VISLKPSSSFLKVIGLLAVFSLAPATIYFFYTRTGGPPSPKELKFQKNLRYAFMTGADAIDLAPLADWPWIKVCALDSGLSHEDVTAVLGFDYINFAELHWLHLPEYWTLAFVDSEREANWGMARPVTVVRISRKDLGDLKLPDGAKGQCISKDGRIEIARRTAPVGESPVVVHMIDARAD